jgi:hypothetical protein
MPSLRLCFPGTMSARPRPIFVIALRPEPRVDGIRALRAGLKVLKRRYGLKCVTINTTKRQPKEQKL